MDLDMEYNTQWLGPYQSDLDQTSTYHNGWVNVHQVQLHVNPLLVQSR